MPHVVYDMGVVIDYAGYLTCAIVIAGIVIEGRDIIAGGIDGVLKTNGGIARGAGALFNLVLIATAVLSWTPESKVVPHHPHLPQVPVAVRNILIG